MGLIRLGSKRSTHSANRIDWRDALFATLLFSSLFLPTSTAELDAAAPAAPESILAWLKADGRFDEFLELISVAELEESLFEAEATTLFVPTDESLAGYSSEALALLRSPKYRSDLVEVLRFHAVQGRWDLEKLGKNVRIESLQGQDLALRWLGGKDDSIDSAKIIEVDTECANGIVHVIDDLILPTGVAIAASLRPAASGPVSYEVDIDHSSILFRVMHMEVGAAWGWFRKFEGELVIDESDMASSSIALSVDVSSIDTNNESRDAYLQTADFFAAKEHPKMVFESTSVKLAGKDRLQVEGTLSFRGVSREISFEAKKLGEGRFGPDWYKIGYEAEFSFMRSDFGMTFGIPGVAGDEVRLVIAVEGGRPFE